MEILNALDWGKFKKADNDHLLPIRQLETFKRRSMVESDEKLSAKDKEEQLKAIDEELSTLDQRMKEIAAK